MCLPVVSAHKIGVVHRLKLPTFICQKAQVCTQSLSLLVLVAAFQLQRAPRLEVLRTQRTALNNRKVTQRTEPRQLPNCGRGIFGLQLFVGFPISWFEGLACCSGLCTSLVEVIHAQHSMHKKFRLYSGKYSFGIYAPWGHLLTLMRQL